MDIVETGKALGSALHYSGGPIAQPYWPNDNHWVEQIIK